MSARLLRFTDAQLDLYRQRRSGVGNAELVDAKRIGPRLPEPLEREILAAILDLLKRHPKIGFAVRMNTGATRYVDSRGDARFVRYGFPGCPDIWAVLRGSGKLFLCEVKSARGVVTDEQQAVLDAVNAAGGIGIVARSIADVARALESR